MTPSDFVANMLTYDLPSLDATMGVYFGTTALNKQKSMNMGRHPASMPKKSELWHYTKLSTQRRNRIKKGHGFWEVVDEENVHATIPNADTAPKEKEDEYTIRSKELHFLKGSSINKTLRNFLSNSRHNDMQHLELRVDFKNKNQVYFGMSFIIMNYADEILYVNDKEELRCKPIGLIEPSDRIKFKMVDLLNPSNPQPLSFGDTMYLQCLDANEAADNSFSVGSVLSAKLFGLPQHSSLNFDIHQNFTTTDSYSALNDIGAGSGSADSPKQDTLSAKYNNLPGLQHSPSEVNFLSPKSRKASVRIPTKMQYPRASGSVSSEKTNYSYADDAGSVPDDATVGTSATTRPGTATIVDLSESKALHYARAATICGDVHLTRICEVRQMENSLGFSADFGLLSDDKALRYTSKAAALLGKWNVHSALHDTVKGDNDHDGNGAQGRKNR
jgi:hypothetical protein